MKSLTELPNIGNNLAEKLENIGIETPENLISTGSEDAFIRMKTVDQSTCINTLYALEGAVQNIRWHGISKERKTELLDFFNSIK